MGNSKPICPSNCFSDLTTDKLCGWRYKEPQAKSAICFARRHVHHIDCVCAHEYRALRLLALSDNSRQPDCYFGKFKIPSALIYMAHCLQEFGKQNLGTYGGLLYSLVVSASALGSLNASIFATAVLCVAASRRKYFPAVFANLHCESVELEIESHQPILNMLPRWTQYLIVTFLKATSTLRWEKEVPV
jgi:hypothetical protein